MREAPKFVYARGGKEKGTCFGFSERACFEGCTGGRLNVKWKNGKRTYPCSAGTKVRADGNWQII